MFFISDDVENGLVVQWFSLCNAELVCRGSVTAGLNCILLLFSLLNMLRPPLINKMLHLKELSYINKYINL